MSTNNSSETPVVIITETSPVAIVSQLAKQGVSGGHFTNGTYAYKAAMIVPTVLAGFRNAMDRSGDQNTALVIAVNSDVSMKGIMNAKIAAGTGTQADLDALESQNVRALKVAAPLALQNPDRKVVVVFYDEDTPNALYTALKQNGFGMESLFKWGYGTTPNAGVIEGAEHFGHVYGHPLPNDTKPLCAELTRTSGQAGSVEVLDLRVSNEGVGPYISSDNKCTFTMRDASVLQYAAIGKAVPNPTQGMTPK